eukprot:jgi/Galph1/3948/GphlegSOOS_G2606.1
MGIEDKTEKEPQFLHGLNNKEQFEELCKSPDGWRPAVVGFGASWLQPSMQVKEVLETLSQAESNEYIKPLFCFCNIEEGRSLAEAWGVSSIPCVLFFRDGSFINIIEGADIPAISRFSRDFIKDCHLPLNRRLEQLIHKAPIVLFMKGTRERPFCKFSKRMVEILKSEGVEFDYFDILSDQQVREGLKQYSNWPTYPQLYARGNLVGGLDIIEELHKNGSLKNELESCSS